MARLQDFNTVTPTNSDNILIVQSTGQGLATFGSTIGAKMDKTNPTGTGSLSLNRASGSTTGPYSTTEGYNCEASSNQSHAEGRETVCSGAYSHSEGYKTTASGDLGAHSEGNETTASGRASHSEGTGTNAHRRSQHCFGEYNIIETGSISSKGTYVEIVGNGTADDARSNARTLDWNGNETIAGTLTQSSDERLKDIKNEAIPDVSGIKAVRFTWKETANRDDSEHVGYIAQDVEKVLPFLVKEDAEGNKTLDYIAFLVAKVDSLEKRLAELENK